MNDVIAFVVDSQSRPAHLLVTHSSFPTWHLLETASLYICRQVPAYQLRDGDGESVLVLRAVLQLTTSACKARSFVMHAKVMVN